MAKCLNCNGNGSFKCTLCNGTGQIIEEDYSFISYIGTSMKVAKRCIYCNGTGWQKCKICNGTGEAKKIDEIKPKHWAIFKKG